MFLEESKPTSKIYNPVYIASPDKNCQQCLGTGILYDTEGNTEECLCIKIQKIKSYLTPLYISGVWNKDLDVKDFREKDVFLQGSKDTMISFVKSYLLNTGATIPHISIFGNELTSFFFQRETLDDWTTLTNKSPFVILFLGEDSANKMFGDILIQFVEMRRMKKLQTFVYSTKSLNSEWFSRRYSSEFVRYVEKNFHIRDTEGKEVQKKADLPQYYLPKKIEYPTPVAPVAKESSSEEGEIILRKRGRPPLTEEQQQRREEEREREREWKREKKRQKKEYISPSEKKESSYKTKGGSDES